MLSVYLYLLYYNCSTMLAYTITVIGNPKELYVTNLLIVQVSKSPSVAA